MLAHARFHHLGKQFHRREDFKVETRHLRVMSVKRMTVTPYPLSYVNFSLVLNPNILKDFSTEERGRLRNALLDFVNSIEKGESSVDNIRKQMSHFDRVAQSSDANKCLIFDRIVICRFEEMHMPAPLLEVPRGAFAIKGSDKNHCFFESLLNVLGIRAPCAEICSI